MTYQYDGIRSTIEYYNNKIEYLENQIKELKEIKAKYEKLTAELGLQKEEFDKMKKLK